MRCVSLVSKEKRGGESDPPPPICLVFKEYLGLSFEVINFSEPKDMTMHWSNVISKMAFVSQRYSYSFSQGLRGLSPFFVGGLLKK